MIAVATDPGTLTRETLSRLHALELLAATVPSEPEAMARAGAAMGALAASWRGLHRSLGRYVITAQPAPQAAPGSEPGCPGSVPTAPDVGTELPQTASDPVIAAPVGRLDPGPASRAGSGSPAYAWTLPPRGVS